MAGQCRPHSGLSVWKPGEKPAVSVKIVEFCTLVEKNKSLFYVCVHKYSMSVVFEHFGAKPVLLLYSNK